MGENPKSDYTWVIIRDMVPYELSNIVFKKGPSGAEGRAHLSEVIRDGEHFRLLDAQGKPKLWGYIVGSYNGLEPLEDYGAHSGCVAIEFERDGKWVAMPPSQPPAQ